jgi:endo-1,4-beta-xylanase
LSDGGWLHAPAGLLRQDHSPKPAYEELLKLIKGEWWLAPTKMTTDAHGQFSFMGFLGEYELSLGKRKTTFALTQKGESLIAISI